MERNLKVETLPTGVKMVAYEQFVHPTTRHAVLDYWERADRYLK